MARYERIHNLWPCLVQGFLTAVRQEVTRRHAADKWALDDVILSSEVTHPAKDVDGIKDPPSEGVFIHGLYMDGCSWSSRESRMVDSEPKRLYHPLPVIHVTGMQASMLCAAAIFWRCVIHKRLISMVSNPGYAQGSYWSSLYTLNPCSGLICLQVKDKRKTDIFEAPVYRTKKRTGLNYLTSFSLRTDEPPSKWILRGVALLCSID